MAYDTPLPSIRKIHQLADWGGPYPIQNKHLLLAAERFGLGEKVTVFLAVFPHNTVFQTRREFVNQCAIMMQFLRSKQEVPDELLVDLLNQHETILNP